MFGSFVRRLVGRCRCRIIIKVERSIEARPGKLSFMLMATGWRPPAARHDSRAWQGRYDPVTAVHIHIGIHYHRQQGQKVPRRGLILATTWGQCRREIAHSEISPHRQLKIAELGGGRSLGSRWWPRMLHCMVQCCSCYGCPLLRWQRWLR